MRMKTSATLFITGSKPKITRFRLGDVTELLEFAKVFHLQSLRIESGILLINHFCNNPLGNELFEISRNQDSLAQKVSYLFNVISLSPPISFQAALYLL